MVLLLKFKLLGAATFVIVAVLIFNIFGKNENNKGSKQAVSEGIFMLETMENADADVVKAEIDEFQNELFAPPASEDFSNLTYGQRFASSVIIGDSIAEGLIDYGILSSSNVIAQKGMVVSKAQTEVSNAISRNPQNIFISLGMNDLEYYRGNTDKFIGFYKERIEEIKSNSPITKIFVNNIMPVQEKAIEKNEYLLHIDDYNEGLKAMCDEIGAVFIDNSGLIEGMEDIYQNDGIHLKYDFYPLWLDNMAKYAGI